MSERICKTKHWGLNDDELLSLAWTCAATHDDDVFLELLYRLEHKIEIIDIQRLELASLDAALDASLSEE